MPGGIRVPVLQIKGLTNRTKEAIVRERDQSEFSSLTDFFLRVLPLPEEMETLIRAGAFDSFGQSRTTQYWSWRVGKSAECRVPNEDLKSQISNLKSQIPAPSLATRHSPLSTAATQLWLIPPGDLARLPSVPLVEPNRLQRLQAEEELLGYPISGHPLEQIVTCGLVIEQRLFHQATGEPMKFLTIADWTGIIETELFARTYQSYGLSTIRYRVLEITAIVEPYENNRGHTLRVLRAGKPRVRAGDGAESR
jgi:DNA polymerase III alpha subunit